MSLVIDVIPETIQNEEISTQLNVNGKQVEIDVTPDFPLLWVLRDTLVTTDTRFGCGIAQHGKNAVKDAPHYISAVSPAIG